MRYKNLYVFLVLALLWSFPAHADTRHYSYKYINAEIHINSDSTIDVDEYQRFEFVGNYHNAFRQIPLDKLDGITDIQLYDGNTPHPFSSYIKSGQQYIEWHYDLTDTVHEWQLHYKVHGAIQFGKQQDRLYWDIFSGYDVPIEASSVTIVLPGSFTASDIAFASYRSAKAPIRQSYNQVDAFNFSGEHFAPQEAFTIDVGWPTGVVAKSAYWKDFVRFHVGQVVVVGVALLCLLIGFLFWLIKEKFPKGRGAIVAQYDPPQDLPPAIAEVIAKEKITSKGLAATVINLAVRGYVTIEEDVRKLKFFDVVHISGTAVIRSLYIVLMVFLVASFLFFSKLFWIGLLGIFGIMLISRIRRQDYMIRKAKEFRDDPSVRPYEAAYLRMLFSSGDTFSTRTMRKSSPEKKKYLYNRIQDIKDLIYQQTQKDTSAFEVAPTYANQYVTPAVTIIAILMLLTVSVGVFQPTPQIAIIMSAASIFGLWMFIRYEARLNKEGRILKEDWRGFKLYLETAEKYRVQDLKPEYFVKYLPYAMIFGIEKKWAQAFGNIGMEAPRWYVGHARYYAGTHGTSFSGSFSPMSFSTSFTSSFASTFGSSGAGGGGGVGGGGAGGGGGGGGGGAS